MLLQLQAANNAGGGFTPASKQLMAVNQEPDTDEGTGEGTHSVARENIVHNHGDGGRVFWTPAMVGGLMLQHTVLQAVCVLNYPTYSPSFPVVFVRMRDCTSA